MLETEARRPDRAPLRAVILDWAGTTIDYGSRAPAGVFVEVFRRNRLPITLEQARGPMGLHKRDHIAALLEVPAVAGMWRELHGRPAGDADIDALYTEMVSLQIEILPQYCDLIPGTLEAMDRFRERGLKVGTTTGYNDEMMDIVTAEAKRRGFEPDCVVTADGLPAGRPYPWMAFRAATELQVYPLEAVVKIGDTVPDVLEGLNAGMWAVAVTKTGNEVGLSEEEVGALPAEELVNRIEAAREKLLDAGAHYAIESIADVPPLLDEIETRLAKGERP
jgi:phosphonoacetaldehyde hydrolase